MADCLKIIYFVGLISGLKVQMEELLKAKERAEKIAKDALGNAKGLREPLDTALNENKELKQNLCNYARDKALLAVSNHFMIFILVIFLFI